MGERRQASNEGRDGDNWRDKVGRREGMNRGEVGSRRGGKRWGEQEICGEQER